MRIATSVFNCSRVATRVLRPSPTQRTAAPVSALLSSSGHAHMMATQRAFSTSSVPRSRADVTATAATTIPSTPELASAATRTRAPRPELPAPQFIDVDGKCVIKYVELLPAGGMTPDTPTIVLIHGAPGTYNDFRYLMPQLQQSSQCPARVLGVNLPGFDGSDVLDTDNYYEHISAVPAVQTTLDAVATLCAHDQHVFVLGHSFGGHAAVHFAGLNAQQPRKKRVNLKGLALVASAGFKPHKALQPTTNTLLWHMLRSNVSVLEQTAHVLVRWIYTKYLRFPDNSDLPDAYFAAGIVRCATADYDVFRTHIEQTRAKLPSFIAWAQDDAFMEEPIFRDVAAACHVGPRLAFARGGHNVQKTRATVLATELATWMGNVVSGKHAAAYTKDITQLP